MKDVTHLLEHYRECIRHLWNSGFRVLDTSQDEWDLRDQYSDVASQLFGIFVLQPIGRPDVELPKEYAATTDPFPFLHVVPAGSGTAIYINRSVPPTGYWDDPVKIVMTGEADLKLINYFDFDVLGHRDLEYYLVRVTRFDKHPHLVGRNALVRVRDTKILHSEETL
jgi:hypothetical protein